MTRKYIILYSLLVLLSLAGTMTLTSCSKDDDEEQEVVDIVMEPDNDLPVDIDGVSIEFKILNTDSVAMKTFKEFEDFFFVLTITNNLDQKIDFPIDNDIIGEDLFRVYSSDGTYVGRPWDLGTTQIGQSPIFEAKSSRVIWCSWLNFYPINDMKIRGYELFKYPNRIPLPKGSYYTEFEITIHDGKQVKCRKDFRIV